MWWILLVSIESDCGSRISSLLFRLAVDVSVGKELPMAHIGHLDFRGWLDAREAAASAGEIGGERAYAYASDRKIRATLEFAKPVTMAVEAVVGVFHSSGKNKLLGTAVKVGPTQFPRVWGIVESCARTLGIGVPTVYIANNPTFNAHTFGTVDDSFILVHSGLVDNLTNDELTSVIGHECGHIHNNHVVYLTTLYFLQRLAEAFVGPFVWPARMALTAWRRRGEITADRASLLCTQQPRVCEKSLAKLALGSRTLYDELNVEAFLSQYDGIREGVGRIEEAFASHPWLPKRILALRVFQQSRLFRTRAGLGIDGLCMNDVDERVHKIVKVL